MEFLTFTTIAPPTGESQAAVDELIAREAVRAAELVASGAILRLWRPPLAAGDWKNVGLWSAGSRTELDEMLDSLPLRSWMTIEILPLSDHPNDPGRA